MKTQFTIFLLVLFSFYQTPLGQLLKIPTLVNHFNKHKSKDGVSLMEFLSEHYSANHNDSDQSEDDNLPFKTTLVQQIGNAFLPEQQEPINALSVEIPTNQSLPIFFVPQQHLCRIFHPPQA